ncbi:MAG: DUF4097 family beta strand repeat-containing protein [bacterium]
MRNKRILTTTISTLLILLTATVAAGWEDVDETREASADGTVTIKNISGSVTVVGWDRDEVHVGGTLGDGTERLDFERRGDRVRIEVVVPRRSHNVEGSFLTIHLPHGSELDVATVSADIDVKEVTGVVYLESVSGDIEVVGEMAELETESVSGTIELRVQCAEVSAGTVSGDIDLRDGLGDVSVQSVSGDIEVEGGLFVHLDGSTVSGNIVFRGDLAGDGSYRFESHSGDIRLYLPEKLDADFEVSTFSGDIDNDFGPRPSRVSKYTQGLELSFTQGSGDARVRVETFSGDVELLVR